ncbi:DUF732 domain-containing protein [Nocardia camponoti]|uniref:DUF732 domain-containing protein n=1 Tax=Nocardia camponoti TaxID=1616106 RepID=A0A917VA35_9NOCA|nr:DUF732 domain-containing protein [Nocardia camponoti]GGK55532.1 hypothetical protein GCM10011591_29430 [Nocardia camponoti]
MHAMLRISGKVAGSVAAAAALTVALTACGDNESTASKTPTLSASATTSVAATTPPSVVVPPSAADTTSAAPETTSTEAPQPAPITSDTPAPALSGKDAAFINELKANGVTPADPQSAIVAASYICSTKGSGISDADLSTFVGAIAGTDASFEKSGLDVDKAAKIYIAAANKTYC